MKIKISEVERYPFWIFRLATEEEDKAFSFLVDITEEEIEGMTEMVVAFEKMQERLEELYCSKVDKFYSGKGATDK